MGQPRTCARRANRTPRAMGRGGSPLPGTAAHEECADPTSIVVAHNGAIESVETLGRLGRMEGGETTGRRLSIPRIEAGAYALCRLGSGDLPAVWSGTIAPEHCAMGNLEPGEALQLTLPTGGGH
jgi:hypothetical protein